MTLRLWLSVFLLSGCRPAPVPLTISRKYPVSLWFCASRKEMALRVLEYFLAGERMGRAA